MPARIRARHAPPAALPEPTDWPCLRCGVRLGTLLGGTLRLDLAQVAAVALAYDGSAAILCRTPGCQKTVFWWPTREPPDCGSILVGT